MNSIWKVEISPDYLTFTKQDVPIDFDESSVKMPYNELNGVYCGHRGIDDTQFQLNRHLKYDGSTNLFDWRMLHGYAYAWEPSLFYEYGGSIYATHVNFR